MMPLVKFMNETQNNIKHSFLSFWALLLSNFLLNVGQVSQLHGPTSNCSIKKVRLLVTFETRLLQFYHFCVSRAAPHLWVEIFVINCHLYNCRKPPRRPRPPLRQFQSGASTSSAGRQPILATARGPIVRENSSTNSFFRRTIKT